MCFIGIGHKYKFKPPMAPRYNFIPRCFDLLSIKLWSAKPAFDQNAFSNYAVTILFHLAFLSFKNLVTEGFTFNRVL